MGNDGSKTVKASRTTSTADLSGTHQSKVTTLGRQSQDALLSVLSNVWASLPTEPWFYANATVNDLTGFLEGQEEGAFAMTPSPKNASSFCLLVKHETNVMKVEVTSDGQNNYKSPFDQEPFPSLQALVAFYQVKRDTAPTTLLENPPVFNEDAKEADHDLMLYDSASPAALNDMSHSNASSDVEAPSSLLQASEFHRFMIHRMYLPSSLQCMYTVYCISIWPALCVLL
jgi:hypothetical protein